jgi:hypothetical protein
MHHTITGKRYGSVQLYIMQIEWSTGFMDDSPHGPENCPRTMVGACNRNHYPCCGCSTLSICLIHRHFMKNQFENATSVAWMTFLEIKNHYLISRPIRRTFFPKKCDINLTCVLCAEGKYYFQTYKYPYSYYTTSLSWDREICFQIVRSGITACEQLTFL